MAGDGDLDFRDLNAKIDAIVDDAVDVWPDGLPLYIEEGVDVGWRLWRVEEIDGRARLASLFQPATWPPRRELHAVCWDIDTDLWRPHTSPTTEAGTAGTGGAHACGIWAFPRRRLPWLLMWVYGRRRQTEGTVAFAVGRVKLWGRIVERERGLLAEYAYPESVELWDGAVVRSTSSFLGHGERLAELAEQLADDYGIEATVADQHVPDATTIAAARRLAERVGIVKTTRLAAAALSFAHAQQVIAVLGQDVGQAFADQNREIRLAEQAARYYNRGGFFLAVAALCLLRALVALWQEDVGYTATGLLFAAVNLVIALAYRRRYRRVLRKQRT